MEKEPEPLSPAVAETHALEIARPDRFGTPVYVYSQMILEQQADKALAFPHAFGLTVRYAMKANPNQAILGIFRSKGLKIDASSGFEVERAIRASIRPEDILLTAQQVPENLPGLVESGIQYCACSLHQLSEYGRHFPGRTVSVRINPGLGSGETHRTNTGGPSSSFGIWHEMIPAVLSIAREHGLRIIRIHTHIGSGSDPKVWQKVAIMSLDTTAGFLDAGHQVQSLNLGGGYKVGRMSFEESTDLQECGAPVKQAFEDFHQRTGIELELEIEPGTFLVADAGCLIARVVDIKSTPSCNFIMIDAGMTEITRTGLYGAQHPISIVASSGRKGKVDDYLVQGHCCESGDILTPAEGDPEGLLPRKLPAPEIGDLVVVGGAGAYCAGMSAKNYNSYPEAAEVLIDNQGLPHLIRQRQTLEQITQNEVPLRR